MEEAGTARGAGKQAVQTEKGPEAIDAKVAGLRRRQKRYIEDLDLDAAEQVEQDIKEYRFNDHGEQSAKITKDLTDRATDIVESSFQAIQQWNKESAEKQKKLRIRINYQFEAIQSRHFQVLTDMEKDFASARLLETQRGIPEQQQLLQRARHAGMVRQFDEARRLRDAADLVAETDLEGRLAALDESFKKKRRKLLKVQRAEIEVLSGRLDSEMRTIEEFTAQAIVKEGELRATKLIAVMDQYGRRMGSLGAPGEMEDRVAALERGFAELLISKNCPVPKGIGCSAATRPTGQEQPARRKAPRRTG
jgi:hypothetical protein